MERFTEFFKLDLYNNGIPSSSCVLSGTERHVSDVSPNIIGFGGLVLYIQSKGVEGTVP
jgi:hypothetical protein